MEEEKLPPMHQENYLLHDQCGQLKDILEEPEESQWFDRSSSLNSQGIRRFLSNEELKITSDLTKNSRDGESGSMVNFGKNSRGVKSSKVLKKGLFFFNERVLTLTATPRLYYTSHGVDKEIDLNPTTSIRQLTNNQFEITNYYPTTRYRFKTTSEYDCEDWVVTLKKSVQTILSE